VTFNLSVVLTALTVLGLAICLTGSSLIDGDAGKRMIAFGAVLAYLAGGVPAGCISLIRQGCPPCQPHGLREPRCLSSFAGRDAIWQKAMEFASDLPSRPTPVGG
jgi:hypothetical protein